MHQVSLTNDYIENVFGIIGMTSALIIMFIGKTPVCMLCAVLFATMDMEN